MFEALYSYTDPLVKFTAREKRILESYFSFRQIPARYILSKEGKTARELYFIVKGLLRLYYTKDGEDITAFIFRENLFAAAYDSFIRQAPGNQTLESLEESDLLVLSYEDLQKLYEELPVMNVLVRKIAEQRFINAQMILSSYILDSPEERYKKFRDVHGDLLLRVPHHMIASFLGISPVSLSRIRRRLM